MKISQNNSQNSMKQLIIVLRHSLIMLSLMTHYELLPNAISLRINYGKVFFFLLIHKSTNDKSKKNILFI